MSKRSQHLLPLFLLLSALLVATSWASDPPADVYGARLASYDKAARTIALMREEGADHFAFVGNEKYRHFDQ